MQFEALKIFCDVARCRSFSQAAAANHLTQSAVSQIVLQLEKRLGVQLVDRSTRPLQLTDLGKVYLESCQGLVEQYLELEASIRNAHDQMEATIRVAAIYSVGLGDMGHYAERFMQEHPHVTVQLEYLHPDRVYEKVHLGTADFGLVSFPRKSREWTVIPWREEPMVLACAPDHPLAAQRAVKLSQLFNEKYIGFNRELLIRREIDRFLREHGVLVDIVMAFDNIENIKKAIEISAGIALLPEPTVRREVEGGTLMALPLQGARLVRPLGIIHRRHHRLTASAQQFIALLRLEADDAGLANGEGASACPALPPDASRGRNGKARAPRKRS